MFERESLAKVFWYFLSLMVFIIVAGVLIVSVFVWLK